MPPFLRADGHLGVAVRGDGQVEEVVGRDAGLLADLVAGVLELADALLAVVGLQVHEMLDEAVRVLAHGQELLVVHGLAAHGDDLELLREQPLEHEVAQGGEELAARQVARSRRR